MLTRSTAKACHPPGDANCDGVFDNSDVDCFVDAVTFGECTWRECHDGITDCGEVAGCDFLCVCDMNVDGVVDNSDIDPFVDCLTYGCVPVIGTNHLESGCPE